MNRNFVIILAGLPAKTTLSPNSLVTLHQLHLHYLLASRLAESFTTSRNCANRRRDNTGISFHRVKRMQRQKLAIGPQHGILSNGIRTDISIVKFQLGEILW